MHDQTSFREYFEKKILIQWIHVRMKLLKTFSAMRAFLVYKADIGNRWVVKIEFWATLSAKNRLVFHTGISYKSVFCLICMSRVSVLCKLNTFGKMAFYRILNVGHAVFVIIFFGETRSYHIFNHEYLAINYNYAKFHHIIYAQCTTAG